MDVEIDIHNDKIEVVCAGSYGALEVQACIDRIRESKDRYPEIERCLVDCRQAQFEIDLFGRFVIGEYAAQRLAGRRLKVALVARRDAITRMVENTAHNRGLSIFTTDDINAAEAWLGEARPRPDGSEGPGRTL
jgi:hypothetical protein